MNAKDRLLAIADLDDADRILSADITEHLMDLDCGCRNEVRRVRMLINRVLETLREEQ